MLKTWFKSAIPFSEEEISLLNQKGYKLSSDRTFASFQENASLDGNAEVGFATSYTEKSITKYESFYVAKKEYHSESSMGYEPSSSTDAEEEDFPSLEDAFYFISQARKF